MKKKDPTLQQECVRPRIISSFLSFIHSSFSLLASFLHPTSLDVCVCSAYDDQGMVPIQERSVLFSQSERKLPASKDGSKRKKLRGKEGNSASCPMDLICPCSGTEMQSMLHHVEEERENNE